MWGIPLTSFEPNNVIDITGMIDATLLLLPESGSLEIELSFVHLCWPQIFTVAS